MCADSLSDALARNLSPELEVYYTAPLQILVPHRLLRFRVSLCNRRAGIVGPEVWKLSASVAPQAASKGLQRHMVAEVALMDALQREPTDFVGALNSIPRTLRTM